MNKYVIFREIIIIITYFRSSSFNCYQFCPFQYYLEYVLGLPKSANKAANLGNMVHKAMELLAKKKLAQQLQLSCIADESGDYELDEISVDEAVKIGYNHYVKLCPEFDWTVKDQVNVAKSVDTVLTTSGGKFDPKNLEIFAVERFFHKEIDQPWANYNYELNDQKISGTLAIKGHIDLVVKNSDDTIEIIDYKNGKYRKDWNTGKEKGYQELANDPQLRMYHYAAYHLFGFKTVYVTIFYINAGGVFTIPFDESDLLKTENMLMNQFLTIKKNRFPKLIFPDWKCSKFCHYGKNLEPGTDLTICKYNENQLIELGIDKLTSKHTSLDRLNHYYSGGGSTATYNQEKTK